jgi:hypothetical protein
LISRDVDDVQRGSGLDGTIESPSHELVCSFWVAMPRSKKPRVAQRESRVAGGSVTVESACRSWNQSPGRLQV